MKTLKVTAAALVASAAVTGIAHARDQIKIVGSSTVFPYTQAVSEEFANKTAVLLRLLNRREPVAVSRCSVAASDLTMRTSPVHRARSRILKRSSAPRTASRTSPKPSLVTTACQLPFRRQRYKLGPDRGADLQGACGRAPGRQGRFHGQSLPKWSDIDPSLPDAAILAFGPPPTSGTRDAFVELAMHDGCNALPGMKDLKRQTRQPGQ